MRLLTVATEVTSPLTLPCQSHALHMQSTSCWFSIAVPHRCCVVGDDGDNGDDDDGDGDNDCDCVGDSVGVVIYMFRAFGCARSRLR